MLILERRLRASRFLNKGKRRPRASAPNKREPRFAAAPWFLNLISLACAETYSYKGVSVNTSCTEQGEALSSRDLRMRNLKNVTAEV
jgi:hypothetical protein